MMKGRVLTVFASVLAILGASMLVINLLYLLSGNGVYWTIVKPTSIPQTGGLTLFLPGTEFFSIPGWSDLEHRNKLHVPFITKALVLLVAAGIVWKRRSVFTSHGNAARWMVLGLPCAGVALAVIGLALWLLGSDQHAFVYKNGSALNFIVTVFFILTGALLIRGSLGLITRDNTAFWIMAAFFVVGACNEIANVIVVIAFPSLISMKDLLAGWYLRLGVEAVLLLLLNTAALLLIAWLRDEAKGEMPAEWANRGQSVLNLD